MTHSNAAIYSVGTTIKFATMNLIYFVFVLVATFGLIIIQFILWSGLGIILEKRSMRNLRKGGDIEKRI